MALTIDVNTNGRWQAQKKICQFYGRKIRDTAEYPNGILLRFVKTHKNTPNSIEKAKIDKLRERQKVFLKTIHQAETSDIVNLDYSTKSQVQGRPTLCQMIMSIKSV